MKVKQRDKRMKRERGEEGRCSGGKERKRYGGLLSVSLQTNLRGGGNWLIA